MEQLSFAPPPVAKILGSQRERIRYLLQVYSERGHTLKVLAGPKHMGRSLATLKKYCRNFQIKFPDYVPMSMRPPMEKKKKAVKNDKA